MSGIFLDTAQHIPQAVFDFEAFARTFHARLRRDNKWVVRAGIVLWQDLENQGNTVDTNLGRPPFPFRMVLGALIVKELLGLSDRATVEVIAENPYIQFFLGLRSFSDEVPFDPSSMTNFRKRIDDSVLRKAISQLHPSERAFEEHSTPSISTKPTPLINTIQFSKRNDRAAEKRINRNKPIIFSDEFWAKIEPLLPDRARNSSKKYQRAQGAGRKPISKRAVFAAILYVARTGVSWKALSKLGFAAPSTVHGHFLEWSRCGVFEHIWAAGLAEHEEMEGISWLWEKKAGDGKNENKTATSLLREWHPTFQRRVRH